MQKWQRTLYILFTVQLFSVGSFSLVFPFLPLYVRELGVSSTGTIEFWSGMVFSGQAFTMMITSPFWGSLGDRYGRKLMLVRATIGGAIFLALMGFAQSAEQLVLLRTIQGAFTGVLAAVNALAAGLVPKEKSGYALGLMQMGRWVGIGTGPLLGGILSGLFGFRQTFWITSAVVALCGLAVVFWVDEEFTPVAPKDRPGLVESYRSLYNTPGMQGLYGLTFLRSLGQTLVYPFAALYMAEILSRSAAGADRDAAIMTGLMIGAASISGAITSVWMGRLGDRIGHNSILVWGAVVTLLFYLPQPFVENAWQLIALQAGSGAAIGAMLPPVAAMMNLWTPSGAQGATFGLENSINAGARIIAPMLGAGISVWFGLSSVFGAGILVYAVTVVVAIWVARSGRKRVVTSHVPS